MSPKPQIRSLKKKPTSPDQTTVSVATEETIEDNPTVAPKQKQKSLTRPPEETAPTTVEGNGDTPPTLDSENNTEPTNDELETDKPIFQAIGTINTKPEEDSTEEGKFFLRLGGKRYSLFIAGYRYQAWLKQMASHPGESLYLRVYPKCLMIPRKPPRIYFQVATWEPENVWEEEPGIFKFRGLWQFVPQVRTPVMSIYRNHNAIDPKGKFKATHIPVLMRRDDESAPFRFNPKIAKEDLPPRWFIQGLFKFIPSRDSFGFSKDLEPPTKEIPWYKKPVKEVPGKMNEKGTENKSEKSSPKKLEKPQKKAKENDND
ncbi:hypothetical protein cce_5067 [Crocosphaera subtropica ATCC 51142]|uniref:Uncharacterized protein n=1 Tax=Crocosphaera subtropica (strain ATCC 51142 / BH68) TaxID=43989 RepID=B1X2Q2_CROS5|nr:hypothetical protein [Crocosphaera subtropica]ACB54413.1 hypothetical protein cce_5067 [Crocosphaera subtropica ATCC 51142]